MNSSFSLRRFGVISRISSARWSVCTGGSKRRQLVAHRQLVAVLVDERADVVALERDREAGERSGDRVARRERRGVVVDRDRLVVAGDHHHVVVRLAPHRALRAQVLEVRVRVGDELVVAEEVDGIEVGHSTAPADLVLDDLVEAELELEQHLVSVLAVVGRLAHCEWRLVELHWVRGQDERAPALRRDRLEVAVGDRLGVVVQLERVCNGADMPLSVGNRSHDWS